MNVCEICIYLCIWTISVSLHLMSIESWHQHHHFFGSYLQVATTLFMLPSSGTLEEATV